MVDRMYVGVIFYRFRTPDDEKAVKEWEEMVYEEARKHKGFIKAHMFVNESTGEAFDIGFWETEEDAVNFEATGSFDLLKEGMKEHLVEPPIRKQYRLITTI